MNVPAYAASEVAPDFVLVYRDLMGRDQCIVCHSAAEAERSLGRLSGAYDGRPAVAPRVWVYRLLSRADQWLAAQEIH